VLPQISCLERNHFIESVLPAMNRCNFGFLGKA